MSYACASVFPLARLLYGICFRVKHNLSARLDQLEDRLVQVGQLTELIFVDQSAGGTDAPKIAVSPDPVNGQIANRPYTPGARSSPPPGHRWTASRSRAPSCNGIRHVPQPVGGRAWSGRLLRAHAPVSYYLVRSRTDKRSFPSASRRNLFNHVLKAAGAACIFYQIGAASPRRRNSGGDLEHAGQSPAEISGFRRSSGLSPPGSGHPP